RGHLKPAHLSTQAAWDGAGGAELLLALGVERVILPRETPLETIRKLAAEAPFALEVFVHGACCYSVSGRCWWSAALGPRSGNRGTCAQPCRRAYSALPGALETPSPWFSPKDLRLLGRIEELVEAGVRALKIEGRLKDAAYVGAVTRAYRSALDVAKHDSVGSIGQAGAIGLDEVFGRSSGEGFLSGAPSDWRTGQEAGHLGLEVGRLLGPGKGPGGVRVMLTQGLAPGDGLAWDDGDERRGARVTWVDQPGGTGERQLRLRGSGPNCEGTRLWRTFSAQGEDPFEGWDPAWERVGVSLRAEGREGAPLRLVAVARGLALRVEASSEGPLEAARGAGLETILPDRLGSLPPPFFLSELDLGGLAPGLFLRPKVLKATRRSLMEALEKVLAGRAPSPPSVSVSQLEPLPLPLPLPLPVPLPLAPPLPTRPAPAGQEGGVRLRLFRWQDLPALAHLRPEGGFVLPAVGARPSELEGLPGPMGFWLPPVTGPGAAESLEPLVEGLPSEAELLCLSWEALSLAASFPERRFALDWTFNIANSEAAALVGGIGLGLTASPEAPGPIPGAAAVGRLNPLVSLSRYPPGEGEPASFANSHGDRFTRLHLGHGCWGIFLHRPARPLPWPPGPSGATLDALLLEPGDPERVARWLASPSGGQPQHGQPQHGQPQR
ncbi:MAG: U32 family peptidase, partial [Polyangia bacterium]|nr:U32 family peptidase [Polyangia bacterium]